MVAQWIVDGRAPVDVTHYAVERALPYETTRRFRGERTVESARGALRRRRLADVPVEHRRAASVARCCTTGWPRQARGSASPPGGSTRSGSPALSRTPARHRDHVGPCGRLRCRRGRAPRDPRGRRRHGHVPDVEVPRAGPRRRRRCWTGCRPTTWPARSDGSTYTQWCDVDGGIIADVTVTRLGRGPVPGRVQRRDPSPGRSGCCAARRCRASSRHHRRDTWHDAAVGAGPRVARAARIG